MRGSVARELRRYGDGSASEIELESMMGKTRNSGRLVSLATPQLRSGFVRKVYGILTAQLLTTLIMAGLFVQHGQQWFKVNPSAVLGAVSVSSAVALSISLVGACCPDMMRRSPLNYFLLASFTIAESTMIGFVCLRYTQGSVLLCLGLTSIVACGLTVYAMRTGTDLTNLGPYLFTLLLVLCGTGLMMWMVSAMGLRNNPLFEAVQILYAVAGALVFSVFIVYDTQKILGGDHEHNFCVDDYAMAAMCLYLDVIQLFLSLLRLLAREQGGDGL